LPTLFLVEDFLSEIFKTDSFPTERLAAVAGFERGSWTSAFSANFLAELFLAEVLIS
jgi:hypothetical protein